MFEKYDVIVIGGGHAGTEASLAAARAGARTLLVTQKIAGLGQMSCNPAIGGIGKGHLTREIDALGGAMARAIDRAGIQFRTLNASKGPAVRATRAQADRGLYRAAIREIVERQSNLELCEASVDDLIVDGSRITGVVTGDGTRIRGTSVVLTVGTFLGGRILVGDSEEAGGRIGDEPSNRLAARLRDMPFNVAEREDRVARLRDMMDDANISVSEKYRQIMEAYQIETEFGRGSTAKRWTMASCRNSPVTSRCPFFRFSAVAASTPSRCLAG